MAGPGAGHGDGIRVLYVDDDPDMTALTAELLVQEDEELTVETETRPTAGLDRLSEAQFDCVVSDYQMPRMDGLDFLRTLREEDDCELPFIIFTGKGREEVAMEALNLGADRYLQKGGDPRTQYGVLATAIRQAVERQRLATAREDAEQRFRSLFENSPLVIWEEDLSEVMQRRASLKEDVDALEEYLEDNPEEVEGLLDEIRVIDVNENALEYYGADSKAELTENFEELFTAESYRANRQIWKGLEAGETAFRIESSSVTFDGEHRHEIIDVKVPAEYADDYSRVYLTVTDITDQKARQQELRELKAFNEELVEQSPVGLFRLDEDLRVVYENPRAEEIIGLPDEKPESDAIGTDIRDVPSIVEAGVAKKFDRLYDGEQISLEFEFTSIYGKDSYLSGKAVPIFQNGTFDGAIMMLQDVSERKEHERKLQRERDRFSTLFQNFPEPTFEYTFEDGSMLIRDVNTAFERVFGYGSDEAVGTSINELIVPPEDRERAFEIDERVRDGELVDTTGVRKTVDGERPFRIRNIPLSADTSVRGFVVYTDLPEMPSEP